MIPMRKELVGVADVTQDRYTIREALNYFATITKVTKDIEPLAEPEVEYLGQKWKTVIERTVPEDHLPQGPLSQFISSVYFIEEMHKINEQS